MIIAKSVELYLKRSMIPFDLLIHRYCEGSPYTSIKQHVPAEKLAKAVLIKDQRNRKLLAVIPSRNVLNLKSLGKQLKRTLSYVSKPESNRIFNDCTIDEVSALGQAYQLDIIWDERIKNWDDVYLESGGNQSLIHLSGSDFLRAMHTERHDVISNEPAKQRKGTATVSQIKEAI